MHIRILSPFIICGLALIFSGCDDDMGYDNTCFVNDPAEDLVWLSQEIDFLESSNSALDKYAYISQAEFKNETVFIFGNCCPFCATVVPVYDCKGDQIGVLGDGELDFNLLSEDKIIWQSDDSVCTE